MKTKSGAFRESVMTKCVNDAERETVLTRFCAACPPYQSALKEIEAIGKTVIYIMWPLSESSSLQI